MAENMQFDLVSPERSLASFEASSVQVPGAQGDMTVMPGHAPVITTLRPGILMVEAAGQTHAYVVSGGFAEVTGSGLSVLAEKAIPKGDVRQDDFDGLFDAAQASYARAKESGTGVDEAAKLLGDLAALGQNLGVTVKTPAR